MQTDEHFLTVRRHVELNPLRASLVKRTEALRWSVLWRRLRGTAQSREQMTDRPAPINAAETTEELDQLRLSVDCGKPFGNPTWTKRTIARLGLQSSVRSHDRPRKQPHDNA